VQLEAVPLDSRSAVPSLRLLNISKGMLDPFPATAGRPLCTDGMLEGTPRLSILHGRRRVGSIFRWDALSAFGSKYGAQIYT
jgi:hypothetical protein